MLQFVKPSRDRVISSLRSPRRPRPYRPVCMSLEDRKLLAVTLSGGNPPAALVGSPVAWTATAGGHGRAPVYQFRVGRSGGPVQVVRDFGTSNTFLWDPSQEGSYEIQVIVKDGYLAGSGESATASYIAHSRAIGPVAVVGPTSNPLVVLYSLPPIPGGSLHVEFQRQGSGQPWKSTAEQPILPGLSTNVFVAGMLPNTTYLMRHVRNDGATSAPLAFTTGALPSYLAFPSFKVQKTPSPGAGLNQEIVFHVGLGGMPNTVDSVATDLDGNVVWYYDPVTNAFPSFAPSLVPGGTVLLLGNKRDNQGGVTTMREVNLAGDILRETNIDAINAQLAARGLPGISNFNHDLQRLPDGNTAVLAESPRTVRLKGKPTQYKGDMVVVLDQNFQVAWVWDPFVHLNTRRLPTLGEKPLQWTHANSIAWSPADGNLILSMRSQDWVVKLNYARGTGDGRVIWRLGRGGSFRIRSKSPSPWFSHQHDVRYINDNTLVLFDNGNFRRRGNPGAHSRGQELVLDETKRIARLKTNVDLGTYAPFTGSAQKLANGEFNLDSPLVGKTIVVRRNGKRMYVLKMNLPGLQYRTYIYNNLYSNAPGGS